MLVAKQYLSPKIFHKDIPMIPARNGYGDGLVEAGTMNPDVVVLCCDLTESTRSIVFQEKFPERFIEAGVAEQNMAGVAVGLALEGKIPFLSSYAVFSPGRNWDQLRVSGCYNTANIKIAGAHAGISVGPDGATHQALEDIAITRVLPRMTVVVPADYHETKKATVALAKQKGPCYFRFARNATPVFTTEKTPFRIGQASIIWKGRHPRATIIGCGPLLYEALLAARKLEQEHIEVTVINNHTIKPLDAKTLLREARQTKGIVTIEEHQVHGGLFGAVSELFSREYPMRILPVAVMDVFGESGEPDELLDVFGLRAKNIIENVKKCIS